MRHGAEPPAIQHALTAMSQHDKIGPTLRRTIQDLLCDVSDGDLELDVYGHVGAFFLERIEQALMVVARLLDNCLRFDFFGELRYWRDRQYVQLLLIAFR